MPMAMENLELFNSKIHFGMPLFKEVDIGFKFVNSS
jgi:hypothetical protein